MAIVCNWAAQKSEAEPKHCRVGLFFIAKMTNNLISQKGKDYLNIFSQCGTLPILLQQKNIPGFCSLPLCCTSEVANVRHWGARHRAFQYYIHHVCTLHACIRLFCKDLAWFRHFSKKTKKMPLELGSDFTCKFIRVDVCFVDCFISLCWFFVKFSGNSIQANCHLMLGSF